MKTFVTIIYSITALSIAACSGAVMAQPGNASDSAGIDYKGFMKMSAKVEAHRAARLVSKETFFSMANGPDTVILDTRSKEAFDNGHIDGAVHFNFSDFTEAKLRKTFRDKNTRILIYCNNNFINNAPPFETKRIELALNVPTFINLYGYGYKNIYELEDAVDMNDPIMRITRSPGFNAQQ